MWHVCLRIIAMAMASQWTTTDETGVYVHVWTDSMATIAQRHRHVMPRKTAVVTAILRTKTELMGVFVNAWLDDPVRGPKGRLINFKGFAVGDGFAGCVPMAGKPVDWCVDLFHVGFFEYPNA